MHNYFETKIRYEKVMEDGKNKKVVEPYLVDALSFAEAENRIIEEMKPFITGEFTVQDIKRANYSELFPYDEEKADKWYRVKINFITLDEKSGKEKKSAIYFLTQASSVEDAKTKTDIGMKNTMSDYEIESISETKIMDIFPFKVKSDEKQD